MCLVHEMVIAIGLLVYGTRDVDWCSWGFEVATMPWRMTDGRNFFYCSLWWLDWWTVKRTYVPVEPGSKICWIIELMQVMGSQNLWWCLLRNLMMCGIKNSIFTSIFKTILWLYFNLYSARYVWRRLAVHSTVSYIVY